MDNSREQSVDFLNIVSLLMFLISAWAFSPVIQENVNQLYITILAILTLGLMVCYEQGKISKEKFAILVLMAFQLVYKFLGISDETLANHSNAWIFFFTMYLAIFAFDYFSKERLKKFAVVLNILLVINLCYQFLLYVQNGMESLYSTKTLLEEGVIAGGTTFVTLIMLYGMLCIGLLRTIDNFKTRIFLIALIIACFYYILNVQTRATALIILILYTAAVILLGGKKDISVLRIFVLIAVCALFMVILTPLLEWLISLDLEYYTRKFTAIYNLINGSVSVSESTMEGSSLITRLYISGVSLRTWLSNPLYFLFGKGYDSGYYMVSGIGKHSEIIDMFPKYGLVGVSLNVYTFTLFFKHISSNFKKHKTYIMIVVTFLIYSCLNGSLLASVGVMFNWLIPFTLYAFENVSIEVENCEEGD